MVVLVVVVVAVVLVGVGVVAEHVVLVAVVECTCFVVLLGMVLAVVLAGELDNIPLSPHYIPKIFEKNERKKKKKNKQHENICIDRLYDTGFFFVAHWLTSTCEDIYV